MNECNNNSQIEVMISVLIITYQHEKYIRQAIESVLMQKTKYSYEIIIADDSSKDGTTTVLKEYKRKYKDKIKLYLRKKNVGGTKNFYQILQRARGKYIITLEGDDYWTDEYKLEKQVNYLEKHPRYIGVFHRCHVIDEHGKKLRIKYNDMYSSFEGYSLREFEKGLLPGHAATFMYKNIFRESKGKYNFYYKIHNMVGDQTLYCILLSKGMFGFIDEDMSIYRIVIKKNGTSNSSLCAYNNYSYKMWKYYCLLEIWMKKRLHTKVNLQYQRKREIQSAWIKVKEEQSPNNSWILIKVVVMEICLRIYKLFDIE